MDPLLYLLELLAEQENVEIEIKKEKENEK